MTNKTEMQVIKTEQETLFLIFVLCSILFLKPEPKQSFSIESFCQRNEENKKFKGVHFFLSHSLSFFKIVFFNFFKNFFDHRKLEKKEERTILIFI